MKNKYTKYSNSKITHQIKNVKNNQINSNSSTKNKNLI